MAAQNNYVPRYPIYIVSKGRWESRLTAKALERMGISYRIVIEPQELPQYSTVIDNEKILTLPFSNLGQGSIPARNWIWEHSIKEGNNRHWILDDNILYFVRFNGNRRWIIRNGGGAFAAIEDFSDRYQNVALSGMQYMAFALIKDAYYAPFYLNTRIYSCILIDNSLPYRWRGRYNEDTDLSIRALKGQYCTVLFYAFLARKMPTMVMRGGNTDELYRQTEDFDGRLEMAKSLRDQHPDIVSITRKWGRWQHQVDYRPFKKNKLIRRPDVVPVPGVNNYGMKLVRVNQPMLEAAE